MSCWLGVPDTLVYAAQTPNAFQETIAGGADFA
jgi:hypothetical protein